MLLELFWGLITALPLFVLMPLLRKIIPAKLIAATILVAIGFIYVGFALKEDSTGEIVLEVIAALVFYFIAVIGFVKNPKLIAIGILLHGIWDFIHHLTDATVNPTYWPVYCLTIDAIWSIYFYNIFKKEATEIKAETVTI
ncbi:MAG: DUF6010 family protein [Flavobacterium sp.]|uniref:DUF6010 family protein n=1 Tax=Flavobacterium sp. TaxID=239 RepID=UPI003262DAC7